MVYALHFKLTMYYILLTIIIFLDFSKMLGQYDLRPTCKF